MTVPHFSRFRVIPIGPPTIPSHTHAAFSGQPQGSNNIMRVRLHLRRIRVVVVLVDLIEKLVVEIINVTP